ncbi:MAG TPA: nitroreductase/quinone reductase family protein [Solirubrobacterales bacterium]
MGRVPPFDPRTDMGPWLNALGWAARQRPVTWYLVNVGNKVDPVLMRATGGRLKSTFNAPTVLLTHAGAKSGRQRSTPLAYITDGDDVILIASRGGHRNHPAWYHNVMANPDVELWTKGGGGRYRATEAKGEERQRLWDLASEFYPGFDRYQERAGDRTIPVIVCTPRD